jgi:hypothetical protein
VPVKLTVCGLSLALSAIASDALRDPTAWGAKLRPIAQLVPAPIVKLAQYCWTENSVQSVPAMPMLEMTSEAFPVFTRVTICGGVVLAPNFTWPNERLAGLRLTSGAGAGGGLPPPPPPPQATQIPTTSKAVANSRAGNRRLALAVLISIAKPNKPAKIQGHPAGRRKLRGSRSCGVGVVPLTLAVVVKVTVAVTADEPVKLTDEGVTAQVAPGGRAVQVKPTVPVNP